MVCPEAEASRVVISDKSYNGPREGGLRVDRHVRIVVDVGKSSSHRVVGSSGNRRRGFAVNSLELRTRMRVTRSAERWGRGGRKMWGEESWVSSFLRWEISQSAYEVGVVLVEEGKPDDVEERWGSWGCIVLSGQWDVGPLSVEKAGIRKRWICVYFCSICHI